ncbi:hypothetical protein AB9F41_38050, partial [Rhizobium leguminosarum]|uniref:hypothetical protein n=1 Tax=Rhizobium leguminosarum TaxID=384 RepID=UPI003F9D9595
AIEMAGYLEGELVGDLETVHDERRDSVLLGKLEAAHAHLVIDDQKIELMDISLPGFNGFEAARLIRQMEETGGGIRT